MILNEREIIHLEGYISIGEDDIELADIKDGISFMIAEDIARKLEDIYHKYGLDSKNSLYLDIGDDDDEYPEFRWLSERVPKVFLKIYVSDNKIALEQAKSNVLLQQLGCLDIYGEEYGYSEHTILGIDIQNFTLEGEDGGSHSINDILSSYEDKYVHIEMEIIEI